MDHYKRTVGEYLDPTIQTKESKEVSVLRWYEVNVTSSSYEKGRLRLASQK